MFKFRPYGPFEVSTDNNRVVTDELREFWEAVQKEHPGLPDAVGCYIFGTRTGKSSRPWYVGKTERASFKKEAFQPQKLLLYQDALQEIKRGTPLLYLIARLTPAGKFRRAGKGTKGVKFIRQLEELLIGTALSRNPKLVNKKATSHLLEIQVPGYINEVPGARTREARELAQLLGINGKVRIANAKRED